MLPIVEGDGDRQAVPELIRRIASEAGYYDLQILHPHKRGDLPKVRARFEDFLGTALIERAPILWVMDYDSPGCDDVNRDLAQMRERANAMHVDQPIEFAFMVKEFESIFIADWESTVTFFPDISPSRSRPIDPEGIRNAKGCLSDARSKGQAYKETVHQVKLAARANLLRLRDRSPSFNRFEEAVLKLLNQ